MNKASTVSRMDTPRSRRFTELFLTLCAIALCPISMYLIDPDRAVENRMWLQALLVQGVGALILHTVMYLRARYADPFILPLAVALNGLGLAMIYRIDLTTPANAGAMQLMWTGLAMVV